MAWYQKASVYRKVLELKSAAASKQHDILKKISFSCCTNGQDLARKVWLGERDSFGPGRRTDIGSQFLPATNFDAAQTSRADTPLPEKSTDGLFLLHRYLAAFQQYGIRSDSPFRFLPREAGLGVSVCSGGKGESETSSLSSLEVLSEPPNATCFFCNASIFPDSPSSTLSIVSVTA